MHPTVAYLDNKTRILSVVSGSAATLATYREVRTPHSARHILRKAGYTIEDEGNYPYGRQFTVKR